MGFAQNEPIIQDIQNDDSAEVLIANYSVQGVWLPQTKVLFDIQ